MTLVMQEPFARARSREAKQESQPLHVLRVGVPSPTAMNVPHASSWRHQSSTRAPAVPAAGLQLSAGCGYFRMVKLAIEHIVLLGPPHDLALTLHLILSQPCFR
jgi:hypothetical protein